MKIRIVLLMAALCAAAPGFAQDASQASSVPSIDPATVEVPELAFAPTAQDRGNFHKYFFFWKEGVSFERARADLEECYIYRVPGVAYVPFHLDIESGVMIDRHAPPQTRGGGLIGGLIGDPIERSSDFQEAQKRLRMCMGFKKYVRYGASKPLWQKITGGDGARALVIQAKIASGPTPAGERVDP